MITLLTILASLARGMREGIIMTQPGPREHVAFGMYHALDLAVLAGVAMLAIRLAADRRSWGKIEAFSVYLLGLAILAWECSEVGYALARGLWGYEHIAFADIVSFTFTGRQVWVLHSARIAAAGILLWKGRMK